jgi:mono/diheme cytochrome c family protein
MSKSKTTNKNFLYYIFAIPALLLALIALIISFMGLGMLAFFPGGIALLVIVFLHLLYKQRKKLNLIIGSIALVALLFSGMRSLFFQPKLDKGIETQKQEVVSQDEIGSDLDQAFDEMDFGESTTSETILSGEKIYAAHCARCHQPNGMGIANKYPPLAQSDYLENRLSSISAVVHGLSGENVINDQLYSATMPKAELNDKEMLVVINYIFSSWGNNIKATNLSEIQKVKAIKP